MCFFGGKFEGAMEPLTQALRARTGLLYTMPDVILNYHVQGVLAGFSYSIRYEKAPEVETWFGDAACSDRLRSDLGHWLETVKDMSFSTVTSFRLQVLPTLTFGGGKRAAPEEDKKPKKKRKPSAATGGVGARGGGQAGGKTGGGKPQTSTGAGAAPGPVSSGNLATPAGNSGGISAAGGAGLYCVFRLAELYELSNLAGNVITCRSTGKCSRPHPSNLQAVDKAVAKKSVAAASNLAFAADLLKKIG